MRVFLTSWATVSFSRRSMVLDVCWSVCFFIKRLAAGWTFPVQNPRFFAPVEASRGAHPASCRSGIGSPSPRVKWSGSGLDHSSPPGAEVKERVELKIYSPTGPPSPVLGWTLLLTLLMFKPSQNCFEIISPRKCICFRNTLQITGMEKYETSQLPWWGKINDDWLADGLIDAQGNYVCCRMPRFLIALPCKSNACLRAELKMNELPRVAS